MRTALRMSALHAPTLKEDPAEAEIASHRLMLRSGMIRKAAAGIYTFLPLGWRALRKVEQIVREEMDAVGSQEMLMPAVQPAELWHESGRWDVYGPELMRLQDRQGRDFCLGPTHEEIITATVRDEVRSYRQLPISLYQIQVKFRDEIRPRFGLLRGREFLMKDAYSFHDTQESLQAHYEEMSGAYARVCERLALDFRPVEADSGQIGGSVTTEFMALAEYGEAALVHCACGWAANVEAAATIVPPNQGLLEPVEMQKVHTPGLRSIRELAEAFDKAEGDLVKTMVGKNADDRLVFFCVPGDRELNPVKVAKVMPDVTLLDEAEFDEYDIPKGSLGPVSPPEGTLVVADGSLETRAVWDIGANENDYHLFGAQPGRDFQVDEWADLVFAQPGDGCPACGGVLEGARGIEVSQVFQLGTKYSEAMGATFTAEDGTEKPFIMGCYGIGVSRSLAAVIEQHHDENGITWPMSVAPIEVSVLPLAVDDDEVFPVAERIWNELADAGVEVVIDDRNERAGVKFADNDLLGFPYQVIVGKKGLAEGAIEFKDRTTGERSLVPLDDIVAHTRDLVLQARAAHT